MIKKLLLSSLTIVLMSSAAQNFSAMYPFTAVSSATSGNTGTIDPTPVPTASGVTFGSFMAFGTPGNTSANGVFGFSNWSTGATNADDANFTGAPNTSQYYEVTITPAAQSTISFSSIAFNMSRSSTGPRHWAVRGSADNYSANLTATIAPPNPNISVVAGDRFFWSLDSYTVSSGTQEKGSTVIPGAGYANVTNPVTFRLYPWNAEGSSGTFRIDTVIFNGSVATILGMNKATYGLNSNFNVYPNPSNDGMFTLETKAESAEISVVNTLGAEVASQSSEEGEEKIKLNLSKLPAGIYFVKIRSGNKISSQKLIISER
jgi:hypothetical protein